MGTRTVTDMSTPTDTLTAHPAALACTHVDVAVDALGEAVGLAWSASDAELVELVKATDVLVSRVSAVQAQLIGECTTRDLPARAGATGGTAWLAGVLTARPGRAAAAWRLAQDLAKGPSARVTGLAAAHDSAADPTPATAASTASALATGRIDVDQAAVIAKAVAALPGEVDQATRASGEAYLLRHAQVHHAGALAHLADRLLEVVAPDVAEARLGDQLARDEARASQTSLTAADDRHGMVSVKGRFDVESWAFVAAALDPLAAPRPLTPPAAADSQTPDSQATDSRGSAFGHLDTHLGSGGSLNDPTTGRDTRPHARRMADALVELARRALDAGDLPASAGTKPHVVVTIDQHALAAQIGTGLLDTGQTMSASAVRRLACDAVVTTILRDRTSHPLDVGRTHRLFTAALRRALVLRDRGCAFPGCSRPPSWCDGHHIIHWADGGPTSLDNGVLLCGHHHRQIHADEHTDGWSIQAVPGGRPVFIHPPTSTPTDDHTATPSTYDCESTRRLHQDGCMRLYLSSFRLVQRTDRLLDLITGPGHRRHRRHRRRRDGVAHVALRDGQALVIDGETREVV